MMKTTTTTTTFLFSYAYSSRMLTRLDPIVDVAAVFYYELFYVHHHCPCNRLTMNLTMTTAKNRVVLKTTHFVSYCGRFSGILRIETFVVVAVARLFVLLNGMSCFQQPLSFPTDGDDDDVALLEFSRNFLFLMNI